MNYQELEAKVLEWADDKGILEKATPLAQAKKTLEEVQELLEAVSAQEKEHYFFTNTKGKEVITADEIKDAVGDILVTIIIGAELQGLKVEYLPEKARSFG